MPAQHRSQIHRPSLALLTDLYELTMAYGYFREQMQDREASFSLFFRRAPFQSGFALCAGLADALDYLQSLRFQPDDVEYLAGLVGGNGQPLFSREFLSFLSGFEFRCDVDAVPEGSVVFAHEPLLRVTGPLLQAQLVETALLNIINFQTLIATKAARVCHAAQGEPVLEFGLRRAQGIDGALSASRAAHLGGCAATSNVLAGKLFGIPVKGTHAHSWVMSFPDELSSFRAYAAAMPNNCVFLVDTFDTLPGVAHAIQVGHELRAGGHDLAGIRLDSGDLCELSIEARRMLDEAGFERAAIVASNDLNEQLIESLKQQGAKISVWGVGTQLSTAYDQPALGGVYKLTAIRDAAGQWQPRLKLSEQPAKVSIPGLLNARRYSDASGFVADAIFDERSQPSGDWTLIDPADPTRRRALTSELDHEPLLQPVLRAGRLVSPLPDLASARERAAHQLSRLPAACRRFLNPQSYSVGLEASLFDLRTHLITEARSSCSS